MQSSLNKYRIGIVVLVVFTLVITGLVFAQAGATKQDNQTYDLATKIASRLNAYFINASSIPNSLSVAGVKDAPPAVSYSKLSSTTYQFCVEYKAASSGFSASSVESDLISHSTGSSSYNTSSSDRSSLYLDSLHKKGKNCQTIKPYLSGYSSDPFQACNSIVDGTLYEQCITNSENKSSQSNTTFTQ